LHYPPIQRKVGRYSCWHLIRELNANNYTGPLSVEWEDSAMDRVHGAKESLEFVRKINFNSNIAAFDDAMKN